jgi:hypothetical protein
LSGHSIQDGNCPMFSYSVGFHASASLVGRIAMGFCQVGWVVRNWTNPLKGVITSAVAVMHVRACSFFNCKYYLHCLHDDIHHCHCCCCCQGGWEARGEKVQCSGLTMNNSGSPWLTPVKSGSNRSRICPNYHVISSQIQEITCWHNLKVLIFSIQQDFTRFFGHILDLMHIYRSTFD